MKKSIIAALGLNAIFVCASLFLTGNWNIAALVAGLICGLFALRLTLAQRDGKGEKK